MSEPKGNMDELRDHLFATLLAVKDKDKDNPMDLDRARAVVQVAGALIDTARVEVEYARVTGETTGSAFLGARQQVPRLVAGSESPDPSIVSRRVHRLEG